jgi:glutathionylspermidine synthase
MSKCRTTPETAALPWRCGPSLTPQAYERLLRRAIFDCCKWHTQVEDLPVLCPFPLLLGAGVWAGLGRMAEDLAAEALAAERELRQRPRLHAELGLPRALRRVLGRTEVATPNRSTGEGKRRGWVACFRGPASLQSGSQPADAAKACHPPATIPEDRSYPGASDVRVMRFDFHWTTDGWRISEANTDVAGGYIEASGVTRLAADCFGEYRVPGDPAGALARAIRRRLGAGARVGLMHLTIYTEDRQIMLYLARRLAEQGLSTCLLGPEQICRHGQGAGAACAEYRGPLDLAFRFFPAEWLPQLPAHTGWEYLLNGGPTPVCNPVGAVLTQSKRFPLVWDRLRTPLPTWRALLPATRAPGCVPLGGADWVLKPALGHEGYNIGIRGLTASAAWRRICWSARWNPRAWAAQRRFVPLPLPTPEGPLYPCLGVYVIDGRAAGAYGRVATRPLIDERSREVVVLVEPQAEGLPDDP